MELKALISTLEALLSNLKSTKIREGESLNDFKMSVERFEAVFSDLIGMSKSNLEISSPETKKL